MDVDGDREAWHSIYCSSWSVRRVGTGSRRLSTAYGRVTMSSPKRLFILESGADDDVRAEDGASERSLR